MFLLNNDFWENFMKKITLLQMLWEMEKINGTQYGSTMGGIHLDDDGKKHYVKYYGARGTPDQAHAEVAAANIYKLLGAKTVNPKLLTIDDNKAVASKWNTNLENLSAEHFDNFNDVQDQDLLKHYIASVLTKNWDSVGLIYDNIRKHKKSGELVTVDTGGTFNFRAMGGHKDYTDDASELHTLRYNNNSSGRVFGNMFKRHPILKHLKSIPDSKFLNAIKSSGFDDYKELTKILLKRKDEILKHYEV
jgi:hypothetical protein